MSTQYRAIIFLISTGINIWAYGASTSTPETSRHTTPLATPTPMYVYSAHRVLTRTGQETARVMYGNLREIAKRSPKATPTAIPLTTPTNSPLHGSMTTSHGSLARFTDTPNTTPSSSSSSLSSSSSSSTSRFIFPVQS